MLAIGFLIVIMLLAVTFSGESGDDTDALESLGRHPVIPGKRQVTLIRTGKRPGLYERGRFVRSYNDGLDSLTDLLEDYIIYEYWQAPDMHYYDRAFWESVGSSIEDAVIDIPDDAERGYYLHEVETPTLVPEPEYADTKFEPTTFARTEFEPTRFDHQPVVHDPYVPEPVHHVSHVEHTPHVSHVHHEPSHSNWHSEPSHSSWSDSHSSGFDSGGD